MTTTYRPRPIGIATYRGRQYAVLFAGETQYGNRLKLAFRDDLEEQFWIERDAADSVTRDDVDEAADQAWREREREKRRERQQQREHYPAAPATDARGETAEPDAETDYCAHCGQRIVAPF